MGLVVAIIKDQSLWINKNSIKEQKLERGQRFPYQ